MKGQIITKSTHSRLSTFGASSTVYVKEVKVDRKGTEYVLYNF